MTPAGDGGRALQLLSAGMRSTILMRVDVNDNGGNDAGSVTVLQGSLDSVRAVGRVHHTEAANITDIRVPGRRRSKAVPLELSDCGCQVEDKELESRGDRTPDKLPINSLQINSQ